MQPLAVVSIAAGTVSFLVLLHLKLLSYLKQLCKPLLCFAVTLSYLHADPDNLPSFAEECRELVIGFIPLRQNRWFKMHICLYNKTKLQYPDSNRGYQIQSLGC